MKGIQVFLVCFAMQLAWTEVRPQNKFSLTRLRSGKIRTNANGNGNGNGNHNAYGTPAQPTDTYGPANAEIDSQQSGPYPPSGWKPEGPLLLVPGESQPGSDSDLNPPPKPEYGPAQKPSNNVPSGSYIPQENPSSGETFQPGNGNNNGNGQHIGNGNGQHNGNGNGQHNGNSNGEHNGNGNGKHNGNGNGQHNGNGNGQVNGNGTPGTTYLGGGTVLLGRGNNNGLGTTYFAANPSFLASGTNDLGHGIPQFGSTTTLLNDPSYLASASSNLVNSVPLGQSGQYFFLLPSARSQNLIASASRKERDLLQDQLKYQFIQPFSSSVLPYQNVPYGLF